LLFSSDEPVSVRKFVAVIEDAPAEEIKKSLARWQERFEQDAWSIRIEQVAGGYQLSTHPDYAIYVSRLYQGKRKLRLSRAALETLAIIAYKQPITRVEIEKIRGVQVTHILKVLLEHRLIRFMGKKESPGRPMLYGTTDYFLKFFGLLNIKDLPPISEFEKI
ncbi:MAG: SMC-Scp complex subunit ScpB, partial [Spirochaetes bacterium]|nr:SMC-Scp complex subunit ScpB [Spirochaetota bacterium]